MEFLIAKRDKEFSVMEKRYEKKTETGGNIMKELDESIIDRCLIIADISFIGEKPVFGDLLAMTGIEDSKFPIKNENFLKLCDLGIEQSDDFFTIPNENIDFGDDNILWIIPLIKKTEVWHNPGPYDGLRFTYDILRNREENKEIYLNCLEKFINLFSVSVSYRGEKQKNLEKIKKDIEKTIKELLENDVKPGSEEALMQ